MPEKFWRKPALLDLYGFCKSEFCEAQKDGRVSHPDGWLGPRSPFWLNSTVEKDQARILAGPKPIEVRPLRRRKSRGAADAPTP